MTQISTQEPSDATNITTDPKDNSDLLGQDRNGETMQSRKRRVAPNQDTLNSPILQTVNPTQQEVDEFATSTDFSPALPDEAPTLLVMKEDVTHKFKMDDKALISPKAQGIERTNELGSRSEKGTNSDINRIGI